MTYAEAMKFLGNRQTRTVRGKRATRISRTGEDAVALYYWGTPVVTWYPSGAVELRTGGRASMTTKARINEFSPAHVYQKNYDWYVDGGTLFTSGMCVTPAGHVIPDDMMIDATTSIGAPAVIVAAAFHEPVKLVMP